MLVFKRQNEILLQGMEEKARKEDNKQDLSDHPWGGTSSNLSIKWQTHTHGHTDHFDTFLPEADTTASLNTNTDTS